MNADAHQTWTLNRQLESMPFRLLLLAILFVLEKSLLNLFVDFSSAQTTEGLGALVRLAQHIVFRFLVTFGVAAALLAYVRAGNLWSKALGPRISTPISPIWAAGHLLLVGLLVLLSHDLYTPQALLLSFAAIVLLWAAVAVAAVVAAFGAMAPWANWRRAAFGLGSVWIYAFVAGVVAAALMQWSERLWEPTARVTFYLVSHSLRPLVPALSADPTTLILRTNHFAVQIAEVCSGLEGVGLMSVFCGAWLIFFRKEYRFPRALALIPIGLALVFLLNVVRIAAFVLIGNAGYPDVAIYGFHSQAGWIAFNLAAGAVVVISRRIRWWQDRPSVAESRGDNPTAAYLMPFLAVIAAGVLARTLSSGFEVWYGLRLIAGLVLLFIYRERLLQLAWGFSWRAAATGILGFGIWLIAAHWILAPAAVPQALLALAPLQRGSWVAIRVISAVMLVPVVEELAFRGYLLRRIVAADFESVRFSMVPWHALAVSSVIFGVSHGSMWIPGVLVGLLYAGVLCKTERFGEAVAAHAVTNGLLAGCVLWTGQWQLW
jgi:exosortase E/protease (VPEID-CTERM system)